MLSAAELIEKTAVAMKARLSDPGDKRDLDLMMDAVVSIFEACNFQDITGQRITKVVRTLKHIEGKIEVLIQALGEEVQKSHRSAAAADPNNEDSLLNGPQLQGKAISQAEIDALFD